MMKTLHHDLDLSKFFDLNEKEELIEGITALDEEMEIAVANDDFTWAKRLAFVQEKLLVRLMLPR